MEAGGDCGLVDQRDLGGPERFERVKHLNDVGVDGLACDPGLVLLAVHAASLDDAKANVDDVNVIHFAAGAACEGSASEEAEDERVETFGGVPIGGHMLSICFAILGRRCTVLFDKPEEKVDKNDVGLAEAALLK